MVKLESTNRIRSASLGRNQNFLRHSRYWKLLFDHLNSIIDSIYYHCEEDESIDECREAILILQNHLDDFESLIEWLRLNKNLESTIERPNSISWVVRKRLPKKSEHFSCYLNDQKSKDSKLNSNDKTDVKKIDNNLFKSNESANISQNNLSDITKDKRY